MNRFGVWRYAAVIAAMALLLSVGCDSRNPSGRDRKVIAKPAVVISQVRAEPAAFDPINKESVSIHFNLSEKADVALAIYDGRDHLVYRRESGVLDAGDHALSWNGQDRSGAMVPAEAYTYTLTAKNGKGQSVYDVTDATGGQQIDAKDVRWDPTDGKVHYYLDKPARVNLRLGLESGPYLRTLIDWVPRAAGAHAQAWDGQDASGVLILTEHPMLKPAVKAHTLPDNTLFVGAMSDRIQFVNATATPVVRDREESKPAKQMANFAQQALDARSDFKATLVLGGDFKQDSEGRFVVKGKVPFRADVHTDDRQRAIQRRFEAVIYVDGTFTYENELGFLPMTWVWDSRNVNPGEHFITFNIRGYEGNFGTATIKVLVEPSEHTSAPNATAGSGKRN